MRKTFKQIVRSTAFLVIAIVAIFLQGLLLFIALFQPALDYRITRSPAIKSVPGEFQQLLELVTNSKVHRRNSIEVLTDGPAYYEAELKAIAAAERSINLEAYIFRKGEVTRRFLAALTEKARAGVKVNLLLDAAGSFSTWNSYFRELRAAGGRVEWYHPIRWYSIPRINNRTHRELLIVDGRVGFVGGAGFADHWLTGKKDNPMWRDTMVRVEGDAVAGLQSAFLENWLETSGEILTGDEHFPFEGIEAGASPTMVVKSSPLAGASTHARVLYQMLLAAAQKSIWITTPYFLPDRGLRAELVRAVRERGVDVRVIAPGKHNDHLLTRRSSRRLYGELLEAGVKIYEYAPAMIHAKTLIVDDVWSVVGSTNFDNRSFGLNDEVNLAAFDAALAGRLARDFTRDQAASRQISFEEWNRRPRSERVYEWFGKIIERQQ